MDPGRRDTLQPLELKKSHFPFNERLAGSISTPPNGCCTVGSYGKIQASGKVEKKSFLEKYRYGARTWNINFQYLRATAGSVIIKVERSRP
jgi:hypothetical protein